MQFNQIVKIYSNRDLHGICSNYSPPVAKQSWCGEWQETAENIK